MNLEELRAKAKTDLVLSTELDKDAQDLPRKKAQRSEWLSVYAVANKRAWWKLQAVKKERFNYYYSEYDVTLDRRDILDTYLPGDSEVQDAENRLEVQKQKVELCERTIRTLNSMGFDIKNIIDYRKLMSGII